MPLSALAKRVLIAVVVCAGLAGSAQAQGEHGHWRGNEPGNDAFGLPFWYT